MFLEERQQKILEMLNKKNKVTVKELTNNFSVYEVTIRKDLNELEKQKLLYRTHGGAIKNSNLVDVPSIYKRKVTNQKIKERIGEKAAEFIEENETIILDSGTTTFQIVNHLKKFTNLNVITNSLEICNALIKAAGIKIILGGEEVNKGNLSIIGSTAVKTINKYNANKLFLGVSALSLNNGYTTSEEKIANIKKCMINLANKIIVVSDSSKFDKVSFFTVCDYDEIDAIITDDKIENRYIKAFKEKNIDVNIVNSN